MKIPKRKKSMYTIYSSHLSSIKTLEGTQSTEPSYLSNGVKVLQANTGP